MKHLIKTAITTGILFLASAHNVAAQGSGRVFMPTSAWLVGPSSLTSLVSREKTPCVMANQFDNGYTIRFSGTDEQIMAIAVDFRKELFEAGEGYDLKISAGGFTKTYAGKANDSSTLILNTAESADLYGELRNADNLVVTFGSTDLPFTLAGAGEGMNRMANCYNKAGGTKAADRGQMSEADKQKKVAAIEAMIAEEDTAQDDNQAEPIDALTEIPNMSVKEQEANNDVADMVGSFLKKAGKGSSLSADQGLATKSFPDESAVRKAPTTVQDNVFQWQARRGADLKQVLNIWTSHRDIGLLWGLDGTYVLPRTFFYEGPIEEAVSALLNEFKGIDRRPVGRIYNDAQKGRMFLLVQTVENQ